MVTVLFFLSPYLLVFHTRGKNLEQIKQIMVHAVNHTMLYYASLKINPNYRRKGRLKPWCLLPRPTLKRDCRHFLEGPPRGHRSPGLGHCSHTPSALRGLPSHSGGPGPPDTCWSEGDRAVKEETAPNVVRVDGQRRNMKILFQSCGFAMS